MTDVLKYDFCEVHIYDSYLVATMKEGVTITPEHKDVFLTIVDTYYRNKNFVYITHRIHSYSVNPAIYKELSRIRNLAGFAVVSNDYKAKSNAEIEKLFLDQPFEVFDTLKEAISWANSVLNIKISE